MADPIHASEYGSSKGLAKLLGQALRLLWRIKPESADADVSWKGPFVILRREWWPTRFMLYREHLYGSADVGWSSPMLVWKVATTRISFQGHMGFDCPDNGPTLWLELLCQVTARLESAIRNPAVYNARVARLLPLRSRTGRIVRKLTWPTGVRPPLLRAASAKLERGLRQGAETSGWPVMSVAKYLQTAALAYDAAFLELRMLSPREKYRRKADGRHGGMLDLPFRNAAAFTAWFDSKRWSGCHPWEIVFGHPHGILLFPCRDNDRWRFSLSVDTPGLYFETTRMALALAKGRVPFTWERAAEVIAALRGEDGVTIGPFRGQFHLDELTARRRTDEACIAWDSPPVMTILAHPFRLVQGQR